MKKLYLFILGFAPLGLGFILNWLFMQFPDFVFLFPLIGICFLMFWAFLGFATFNFKVSAPTSVCVVNLAAFFALILNLYQEIILGQYWGNLLSLSAQFFFLPVLNVASILTFRSSRVWTAYVAGFLLMCAAYLIGFKIRKGRAK